MTLLAWAPDCTARFVPGQPAAMKISPDPEEGTGQD
jgi:hypothetical protein